MRRLVRALLVVVPLALATAVVAVSILVFRPQPAVDGDLRLLGLHDRGEIVRDRSGVPHIFARNAHDLFFLQGYVHAQDRLFQMDLYRRAAHGRLSEVLGEVTLSADKLTRTLSLARAAERDLALLSPEARDAAQAYADGVNKHLEQHGESLPLEFVLLGHRPEPWSPLDSIAVTKLQAYDQAVNFQTELVRMGAAARVGAQALATLIPPSEAVARDDEAAWSRIAGAVRGGATAVAGDEVLRAVVGDDRGGAGSNCWAVAPHRSASGSALLAGDPHLGVRNPGIWYEQGLTGAGYEVVGATIPGVPGVILGHNRRVAWSLTVAYIDQQDLYVEQPDPRDPRRFMFRGSSEAPEVVTHRIGVKGKDPVAFDVVTTRHGPILTPVLEGQTAPLALRWTALDGGRTIDAILALDRVRDFASFRDALALFEGPALTLCYADADGHVGWALGARIPLRAGADDGRLPLPGWTGEHEWQGIVDPRESPFLLDPAEGIAMSSNQLQFAYRWSAGSRDEWDGGFRATRALELLRGTPRVSVEHSRAWQVDTASVASRRLRDALLGARPASDLGRAAHALVRDWDGTLGESSAAAAVYEAWLARMVERTFKDRLGDALFLQWVVQARPFVALDRLAARPADPWFGGDRDAVSTLALEDASRELSSRLGGDPAAWRWGALHRITFAHPLGAALPFLQIGPFDRPGDDDTLNDAPYDWTKPYAVKNHASLRTIVDFADVDGALSVLPVGQSGLPFSAHWGDQTPLWLAGRLKPMPLSRDRIVDPEGRLVLRAR